jgi:LPXTG-motif cell wall-anchored protein
MSRTMTSRLAAAGGLALTTALAGIVLAPTASAADTLPAVTVSATTVAPGEKFTVSGTGCISPEDAEYEPIAMILSNDYDFYAEVEPASDGSWSVTTAFPADMPDGEQHMSAGCGWYTDGVSYPDWTMTVKGAEFGAIRGVEANTPGTRAETTDRTTGTSSTPGAKVVRVISGFQPFEEVTLTMHSEPVVLGTFTADANGVVTAEFTLPANVAAGEHTLVYEGAVTYFQESFTVTAAGPKLAHTGADVTVPLTVGLGLVLAGTGALVVSRRRNAGASQA